ncbi:MAG: fasciclin domain-containing protein [Candidatus Nanopelagicales bacterium]|jgi:uncharacterized surface protein with fasciclin (FAS1) repeats|nr:fasciclin domain-containing protein [Candidatus Nanopelagicales bacterium]
MRKIAAGIAAASAAALAAGALTAPAAMAADDGTKSLAAVLTATEPKFDKNSKDYDILTAAVLAVLADNPDSPVKVLADGAVPLTAFIPNDQAFRILAEDLTGKHIRTEKRVFAAVASLGLPTVETVLLYHVVPGATIDSKAALKAKGAKPTTAQGGTFKVNVVKFKGKKQIRLQDQDRNSRNPRVNVVDINKGNVQIAHGIDRVLRPLDLPPLAK